MDESLRLNWKMRYEWYPNERYLKGFENLLSAYLPVKQGRILDIGCGQSEYILDMLDSKFDLFAQDEEVFQLDYLKQRIHDQGHSKERVNYCNLRFPNTEFSGKFDGIVISNILHFYDLAEIKAKILPPLFDLLKASSILIVTVHSTKHPSSKHLITEASYFKHFFTEADLEMLFPAVQFQTLCYQTKSWHTTVYDEEFLKTWLQQYHHDNGVFDSKAIQRAQNNYLKNGRQDNITVVYKKKG